MNMNGTLYQIVAGIPDAASQKAVRNALQPLVDRFSSCALSSAGLVIKAGSSALAKTGSAAFHAIANGTPLKVAGSTDMPALTGTVANATFNVFCFFIDSAGTVTSQMGVAGATRAAMKFPEFPKGKALVGFIVINPTGTGDFVGGTTALDDGTVTPGAEYVSPLGPFDPTCLLG